MGRLLGGDRLPETEAKQDPKGHVVLSNLVGDPGGPSPLVQVSRKWPTEKTRTSSLFQLGIKATWAPGRRQPQGLEGWEGEAEGGADRGLPGLCEDHGCCAALIYNSTGTAGAAWGPLLLLAGSVLGDRKGRKTQPFPKGPTVPGKQNPSCGKDHFWVLALDT